MKRIRPTSGLLLAILFCCCAPEAELPEASLPRLSFSFTPPVPTDHEIPCRLTLADTTLDGALERRGGFSISFDKHSYNLDLEDDFPLAGLPADDDWVVNANYIDKTFLRHVLSFELFRRMDPDNRAPLTRYVEVEANGNYQGLYVLMQKLDKSSLEIDDDDSTAVVFKEPQLFYPSYEGLAPAKPGNFHHQTYPKIKKEDRSHHVEALREFILTAENEVFDNQIDSLIDLDNFIDWQLLILATNNSDGILKNFYLYRAEDDQPLRVAPWDYDHSFGRDGDNELNMDERTADLSRSILFRRLLDRPWYRDRLIARWRRHREGGVLDPAALKARIRELAAEVRPHALRNFERWPLRSQWYYDENDFDAEIEIMLEFVDRRYARLDTLIERLNE